MSKNTHTLTVSYIEDDKGRITVLPDDDNIQRNVVYLESKFPDTGNATSERLRELRQSAEKQGIIKTMDFDMRAYTYGEKIEAGRLSTVTRGTESHVDQPKMNFELLKMVTGNDKHFLEELPIAIADYLYSEMIFMSEPDQERLLFLLLKPTNGEVPESKKTRK